MFGFELVPDVPRQTMYLPCSHCSLLMFFIISCVTEHLDKRDRHSQRNYNKLVYAPVINNTSTLNSGANYYLACYLSGRRT